MNLTKQQIFMLYFACGYKRVFHFNQEYILSNNNIDWSADDNSKAQLILREFEDMTEAEKAEYSELSKYDRYGDFVSEYHRTCYLAEHGICFDKDWFKQGIAINEKDVK